MQAGMRRFADHPLVGEVRGTGLIGAIELVQNKKTRAAFDPKQGVGPYFVARGHEHGIIHRAIGDAVAFCPPLIINEAQVEDMFGRFSKALDDTWAHVQAQGWV
jgi:4-aminobutyrate--pyruvate transaminase